MVDHPGEPIQPLDFAFLLNHYDAELARKDRLTDSLAFPAGVLIAVVGAVCLVGQNFSYTPGRLKTAFTAMLCGDGVAAIGCLICLAIAYHGRSYEYIPRLGVLRKAQTDLVEWHEQIGGKVEDAARDFEDELERRIITAADRNALNNDRRTGFLYLARVWLYVLLATGTATGLTYIADTIQSPKSIPTVRIENISDLGKALNMANKPATQPAPPPPKPAFPENRVIKEGTIPKR